MPHRLLLFLLIILSPIRLFAAPVTLVSAEASVQQDGYPVAQAIDGEVNNTGGWSVSPFQFSPQSALFRPDAPLSTATVAISLYQKWGSTQWISEFRLSATADPSPTLASAWTTLTPLSALSDNTTLLNVGDRLRSVGTASTATYRVIAATPFAGITAFRLEAFPYDFKSGDNLGASLGQSKSGNFVLTEFLVESDPTSTGNIALRCPVSASGDVWPANPASNLVDGKPNTYTHPFGGQETLGFFYEIDLGKLWEMDRIVVRGRENCCATRLTNYEVQLYDMDPADGGPGDLLWQAVLHADGSNAGEGGADTILAASGHGIFRGRFLRIVNRSNGEYNPQIAEVEVYGSLRPVIASFTVAGDDTIVAGQSTTLAWNAGNVASVTITPDVGVVAPSGSLTVQPTQSTLYTLTATNVTGSVLASVQVGVNVTLAPARIMEFTADQDQIQDEDGDSSDWIELLNPNAYRLALEGYRLSDGSSSWSFPDVTLPPLGRLLVFASGKDRRGTTGPLHTNFSLSKDGETLSLRAPGGNLLQSISFPAVPHNISYGFAEDSSVPGCFKPATPGGVNGAATYSGLAGETRASVPRGFYTAPITVSLSSATPGAQIRYTLNGSAPTATTGLVYASPLRFSATTILRAASFYPSWAPGDVLTHTYLFPESTLNQSALPSGFPALWTDSGNTVNADYAMDPEVTKSSRYRSSMPAALTSIRSISVVMDPADLFGASGIYMNPQQRGVAWERATSIELLLPPDLDHPAGQTGFQEQCGIRIFGYGWRSHTASLKHSFRLKFKEAYDGPSRLNYPLFPGWPVEKFDNLVLRAQGSRSWNDFRIQDIRQTQYLHDVFARDTAAAMGKADAPAAFVHLYLNGLYWGLYQIMPRPDATFGAAHEGGSASEYDALNSRLATLEVVDGTADAWDEVLTLAQSGLASSANYTRFQQLVDLDNLIDYVIYNLWSTNHDGPVNQNNFRAVRRRTPEGRWRFYFWDMEYTLWDADENTFTNISTSGRTLWPLLKELKRNPEFCLRFADRLQKHCFNSGALTPNSAIARWNLRANEIYTAILGESARWGDVRRDPPYTRDAEWAAERLRLTGTYFPQRTAYFLNHAQAEGLFPAVAAPSLVQEGGSVPSGYTAKLFAPAGAIYYTLNGDDPRRPDGTPAGMLYGSGITLPDGHLTLKARVLGGGVWSPLTEAVFLVNVPAVGTPRVVFSELHYHPAGNAREFIELMNVGPTLVDLGGCRFTRGIAYTFPSPTVIAPGARLTVTSAQYTGELSNQGETVTLTKPDGVTTLCEVTYMTDFPWPSSPDGGGPSLTLIRPETQPTLNDPVHWRASVLSGGTPDASDALAFTGDPAADIDGDGLTALAEYALGTSDQQPDASPFYSYLIGGQLYATFPLRPGADDIACSVEMSTDLLHWHTGPAYVEPVSTSAQAATWRVVTPAPQQYLRLRATQR